MTLQPAVAGLRLRFYLIKGEAKNVALALLGRSASVDKGGGDLKVEFTNSDETNAALAIVGFAAPG